MRAAFVLVLAALGASPEPDQALTRLRLRINPEFPAWSPSYVIDRCAEHLATINDDVQSRILYFDMSDVPRFLLPAAISSLHFGCNSASVAPTVAVPRPVPRTDNRVFWVDLLWYRWSPHTWEQISAQDPYFREPLIPSFSTNLNYLKQRIGNRVIRGSWFIFYTYDTTQFLDRAQQGADDAFYYQLVYGQKATKVTEEVTVTKLVQKKQRVTVVRNGQYVEEDQVVSVEQPVKETQTKTVYKPNVPKTAADFEKYWRVDFDLLKEFPVDQGAVVDEGRSGVAHQNRTLWRVRTALGTYWRTFDVFRSAGDQDFVESPFPREFDAGEHIFQDSKGAQFYLLTDGKGKRVEFGDPRAVHDSSSGNKVLLTAASCIHCHDTGILKMRNEMVKLRTIGADLRSYGKERAERVRQFFLGDLTRLIDNDQNEYTQFVKACNGLTPQENTASFGKFRRWYASPVNLAQAARELGSTPEELAPALATGTKGRLGRLVLDGEPVPRITWERGAYQEAFLLLLEYRKRVRMAPSLSGG